MISLERRSRVHLKVVYFEFRKLTSLISFKTGDDPVNLLKHALHEKGFTLIILDIPYN